MQVTTEPRYTEPYHANIPRLSYRRPAPDEVPQSPVRSNVTTTNLANADTCGPRSPVSPGPMIRDIRASIPYETSRSTFVQSPSNVGPLYAQKKKASVFGGLFTKEPTLVALAQVEADLKAKHGSVNPEAVPHVSSSKMPAHVPKVNSAWNGLPQTVNEKERQSKERDRYFKRNSAIPPSTGRSRGSDPVSQFGGDELYVDHQRKGSGSDSHPRSWDYETSEYRRSDMYERSLRSHSVCSDDSDRYGPPRDRPASTWSQSLKSPSGNSLPEITSFFPKNTPSKPSQPRRHQSSSSSNTRSTTSSGKARQESAYYVDYRALAVDAIPEHSSSPRATPRETSPVTPSHLSEQEREGLSALAIDTVLDSSGQKVASPRNSVGFKGKRRPGAFLAGEARPMELPDKDSGQDRSHQSDLPLRQKSDVARIQTDMGSRPRSSRTRLGLGGSMVVRTEAAPWEAQAGPLPTSPRNSKLDPSSPKKRLSKGFGGFGK